MKRKEPATQVCPHCGETFKAGRLACPECGSDAMTGWKSQEEIDYQSVEIPDYYEDDDTPTRNGPLPPAVLYGAAIVVVLAFIAWLVVR